MLLKQLENFTVLSSSRARQSLPQLKSCLALLWTV